MDPVSGEELGDSSKCTYIDVSLVRDSWNKKLILFSRPGRSRGEYKRRWPFVLWILRYDVGSGEREYRLVSLLNIRPTLPVHV